MNKIYAYVSIAILLIFGSLIFGLLHFQGLYKECEAINLQLNALIENQNKAIEKLKIDTENYNATIALQESKLRAKYNNIRKDIDINTCDDKIKEIENALEIFKQGKL